ncbi:phosphoenolpyruvate phosphomutase-domain-containing protein [Aspergillus carlsbadensis]|nr:phosphoenolpyruvate phosphomutase-domain-containing protein [Aspergillus carlsbadensis]
MINLPEPTTLISPYSLKQTARTKHTILGTPLILANTYGAPSAKTIASLSSAKALATASCAVAEAAGTTHDQLPLAELLRSAKIISRAIEPFAKPPSVGAVGVNIEDYYQAEGRLYTVSETVYRIKRVLDVSQDLGVPDFVVNARCDVLTKGGTLEKVIQRGKAYLAAGRGGVSGDEVIRLAETFGGRLKSGGGLGMRELAEIGVGPLLQGKALERIREVATGYGFQDGSGWLQI